MSRISNPSKSTWGLNGFCRGFPWKKAPVAGGGGGGGGSGPTNLRLPEMTGTFVDGTSITLDIGDWVNDTSFEAEIRTGTTNAVAYARQAITTNGAVTVNAIVGETLILHIWATGPGGVTLASSLPSIAVIAAGNTFIGAWAGRVSGDPALPTTPFAWTSLGANPQDTPYPTGFGYGFKGSALGSAIQFQDTFSPLSILKRSMSTNASAATFVFRVDVDPGFEYDIYLGSTPHFSPNVRCTHQVWDGDPTGGGSTSRFFNDTTVPTRDETLGPDGVIRANATHVGLSDLGGPPRRITCTTGIICLGRANATPFWTHFGIIKVNP